MLDVEKVKPITGTFVQTFFNDTSINNWGLEEWENNFALMKKMGVNTIIPIRSEQEQGGIWRSGLDPRSTTWKEDENILDMFFRLCEKHDMDMYLGGSESITNLHLGNWQKEIDDNIELYIKMEERYGKFKCFKGLYVCPEALPWHFNFFEIVIGISEELKKLFPAKKQLFSPTFNGLTGNLSTPYTVEQFEEVYSRLFDRLAGKLDYCAWQDKFFIPDCHCGKINDSPLHKWYPAAARMMKRNNIAMWGNIESFQRIPGSNIFRQADYMTLYMKLLDATPYCEKLITFEFPSCLSPDSEWGSGKRLLERYCEMTGIQFPC